jgi:uncharacterized protein (TIGR04255 family)
MDTYFPKIQDSLRRKGYPLVKTQLIQELVTVDGIPTPSLTRRWQVQNKDKTRSVIITKDFVVFQTTTYSSFDDFVQEVEVAVETVASEVQALVIQRVGLRYVDLVREANGKTWKDFVHPGVQGLTSALFIDKTQHHLYQCVSDTSKGKMIVRLIQNRQGQVLPPDLADSDDLQPRLDQPLQPDELLTILDLDHFSPHQEDYRAGWVGEQAWSLHDDLDQVFRKSLVTEMALESWK